jgi:hypothetical protein
MGPTRSSVSKPIRSTAYRPGGAAGFDEPVSVSDYGVQVAKIEVYVTTRDLRLETLASES